MYDFFIGIRLPKELEEVCENYRRTFKAPRTVAHITVIPPFAWEQSAEELHQLLQSAVRTSLPFTSAAPAWAPLARECSL